MDILKVNPVQFKDQNYNLKDYINRKVKKSKEMKKNMVSNNSASKDFDELIKEKSLCNHDPDDLNTTLIKSSKRTMVSPKKSDYFCSVCHRCFSFIEENGI